DHRTEPGPTGHRAALRVRATDGLCAGRDRPVRGGADPPGDRRLDPGPAPADAQWGGPDARGPTGLPPDMGRRRTHALRTQESPRSNRWTMLLQRPTGLALS